MAEITLDDTKIAVPKRLSITTFLAEIQKKTKQFLYLINEKEVGIFQSINDVRRGMWKKLKPSDEICHYYIDSETEIEYIVFSEELAKKIGSFPYENLSRKTQETKNVQQQQVYSSQPFQQSLPTSLLSGLNPNQISQSSVLFQTQNLQPPITSDFSLFNQQQQQQQQQPQQSINQQYPQYNPFLQNNFIPQQQSYPSINEIPRYNNIDLNDTIQHFANLIQSNQTQSYSSQQNLTNQNPNQGFGFYSQHQNQSQTQNNNSSNNNQPRMSSKSLQNLNRIQAFLKQQPQQTQGQGQNYLQNNNGQAQMQGQQMPGSQPPFVLPNQQSFQQNFPTQQNAQQQTFTFPGNVGINSQTTPQLPLQQNNPQIQNFMIQQPTVQKQQFAQQVQQQPTGIPQTNQQKINNLPNNLKQAFTKTAIPISAVSQQTIQSDASSLTSASGKQKYFPPYQGKKKLLQQQITQTQNQPPQPVENKFTA